MPYNMASVVIRALQLPTWLPNNTQTLERPWFWWTQIIIFKRTWHSLMMDFTILSQENTQVYQLGTQSSLWCTQASNICIAIMIQLAFPASVLLQLSHIPKRRHKIGLWVTWQTAYCSQMTGSYGHWSEWFWNTINTIVDHPLHHEIPGPMIGHFCLVMPAAAYIFFMIVPSLWVEDTPLKKEAKENESKWKVLWIINTKMSSNKEDSYILHSQNIALFF